MSLPTQPVTCQFYDQNGNPVSNARVRFKLTAREIYNGIVAPERIEASADATGLLIINLFPNELGVAGSQYSVQAWNPQDGRKFLDSLITVPNSPAQLHLILNEDPYPAVDASLLALTEAQGALAAVTAQADAATASAASASSSASSASSSASTSTAQAGTATTQAGIATTQAGVATVQAGIATTQAGNAASSASAANGSASAASASASSASDFATTANTKADEAATAASNAAASAATATTQAGLAAASAVAADASADLAAASEVTVQGYASSASSSAAAATASESAAAASAGNASASASAAAASAATASAAASDPNVVAVAGIAADVATVAGIDEEVIAVAGNESNINTVATDIANVNAVGSNIADIQTTVANLAAILDADEQAALANQYAGEASGSAAQALAIYGNTAAVQTAVAQAAAQASLAAGYAASASSVVQQDLSGVTAAALHRSPNAVTSMFVYDTSKDSDGGAWTEKCQHTSWYNEDIYGKWLGAQPSEFYARNEGGVLGSELITGDSSTFNTSIGDWVSSSFGCALNVINGTLEMAATSASGRAVLPVAVVVGKTYRVTGQIRRGTSLHSAFWVSTTSSAGSGSAIATYQPTGNSFENFSLYFTPAQTTVWLSVLENSGSGGGLTTYIDNISVREVTAQTTQTGDYFQLTTDGKFYRLWKNLLTNPNTFTNYNYAGTTATITANSPTVTAPDGTNTATEIAFTGAGNDFAYRPGAIPAGHTYSVWMRSASGTRTVALRCWLSAAFVTCTVTTTWQRFTFTLSAAEGTAFGFDNRSTYGSSGNAGSIFVADAQLEWGTAATDFEAKPASVGFTSEVFRGNKRDFPRLAGIVAEAGNVNIYDLTEPGRPMWMRLIGTTVSGGLDWYRSRTIATVAAANGFIGIGNGTNETSSGLSFADFGRDRVGRYAKTTSEGGVGQNISLRHTALSVSTGTLPAIVNAQVNAVAMTVLPDAPVDPVTGLKVPTIAVATNGGVSVIKHNGTVVAVGTVNAQRGISVRGKTAYVEGVLGSTYQSWTIDDLSKGAAATLVNRNPGRLSNTSTLPAFSAMSDRGQVASTREGGGISLSVFQRTVEEKGLIAHIMPTYNTGYMVGRWYQSTPDTRRTYLSDNVVESVGPSTELVTNGDFSSGKTGWSTFGADGLVVSGGVATFTSDGTSSNSAYQGFSTTVGKTYRLKIGSLTVSLGLVRAGTTNNATTYLQTNTNGAKDFTFVAQSTTTYVSFGYGGAGATVTIDNISVQEVVADRSYKAQGANITGTLTKSEVASAAELVAYSGFSATNYLQEPYSADLDFGTGEWSVGAWVNVPTNLATAGWPSLGSELNTGTAFQNWTQQGTGVSVDGGTGVLTLTNPSSTTPVYRSLVATVGKTYSVTATIDSISGGSVRFSHSGGSAVTAEITAAGTYTFVFTRTSGDAGLGVRASSSSVNAVLSAVSLKEVAGVLPVADRAYSSGASITVGVVNGGLLQATAYDGTTTRTVTTATAYNTATWIKPEAVYTTDGTLAIRVNGVEVAATRGNPLLSLDGRYNRVLHTEQFDNGSWVKGGVTVTVNATTAPDGTATADKIVATAVSGSKYIYQNVSVSSPNVVSIYAKAAEYSKLRVLEIGSSAYYANFNLADGTHSGGGGSDFVSASITDEGDGWYRCSIVNNKASNAFSVVGYPDSITPTNVSASYTGDGTSGVYVWGAQSESGATLKAYQRVTTVAETNVPPLTIGNSYATDAPFPGSIALLKLSATVPTPEQSVWMYEQEKQLFRAGAKCCLPDSGSIVDLTYDDATDKWIAVSAANESEWSGLVRTSVTASPAGSYTKVAAASGIQLQARSTTNPGVDITIPAYGLREELVKDGETNKALQPTTVFDFVGGFTATTVSGNTAITSVSGLSVPYSAIGCVVTGSGIPASTTVVAISGTTIYLSAAATASASGVQIAFTDFNLSPGYTTKAVSVAGAEKREGSTADWTRRFDGFKETVRFGAAPAYNAWVQVQAVKEI